MIWKLNDIVDYYNNTPPQQANDGDYYYAPPYQKRSFLWRIKAAWTILSGRADAFVWEFEEVNRKFISHNLYKCNEDFCNWSGDEACLACEYGLRSSACGEPEEYEEDVCPKCGSFDIEKV